MDDNQIAANVARLREGKMSQGALADAMREAGHKKWSQATVWSLEKGTRSLKFSEAVDLASILEVDLYSLSALGTPIRAITAMKREAQTLEEAERLLREEVRRFVTIRERYGVRLFKDPTLTEEVIQAVPPSEKKKFVETYNTTTVRRAVGTGIARAFREQGKNPQEVAEHIEKVLDKEYTTSSTWEDLKNHAKEQLTPGEKLIRDSK